MCFEGEARVGWDDVRVLGEGVRRPLRGLEVVSEYRLGRERLGGSIVSVSDCAVVVHGRGLFPRTLRVVDSIARRFRGCRLREIARIVR
jgi:hypothetical protein